MTTATHFEHAIGGVGGDLDKVACYFIEYPDGPEGEETPAGVLVFAIALMKNPVVAVFFRMELSRDVDVTKPITLIFNDDCITDNVNLAAAACKYLGDVVVYALQYELVALDQVLLLEKR